MKNYKVTPLKNYPENGKHLEILEKESGTPYEITFGHDDFYWYDNGKEYKTSPHFWYVWIEDIGKGFKTADKAVAYARSQYKKHLQSELKKVTSLIKEAKDEL